MRLSHMHTYTKSTQCACVYWKGQRDDWDDKGLWKASEHDDGAGIP